jgi:hypothetical protein
MSENGEVPYSPEQRPQTLTESTRRYIKDCKRRIQNMGMEAIASGAFITLSVDSFAQGNRGTAVFQGLAAGASALHSAYQGFVLNKRIGRLSEENAKLTEKK